MSGRLEIITHGADETRAVGKILGSHARSGDVFLLVGELGAGKTCLTQGILWGLGVDEYARSPTFVLVARYAGRLTMYHIDLYRLDSVEDVIDLGLDEYLLGDGVSVVEWAEKALDVFPEQHLLIQIDYVDEETRRMTFLEHQRYSDAIAAVRTAMSQS